MEQTIRFCTTEDGVRIAYATVGHGPPLVWCPANYSHLETEWSHRWRRVFFERLARRHTLIRFDKRGTGLSQRGDFDYTLDTLLRDLKAVLDHLGLNQFVLAGYQLGGTMALAHAGHHPDNVTKLVLMGTFHRGVGGAASLATMARENWRMASRLVADLVAGRSEPSLFDGYVRFVRQAVDGEAFAKLIELGATIDLGDIVASVRVPTLVVHDPRDKSVPIDVAREMALLIPDSTLVTVDHYPHLPRSSDTSPSLDYLMEFLGAGDERPDTGLTVVLFTDLVGHTEMMSRLGDERGREVLREHERITRETLAAHGGAEIKTMGDGFMASFGSVTKAVECAVALQRAIDERNRGVGAQGPAPLLVRIGLNAGEPIEEDGDLFGATVILASRIAAKADGGEILVSDTVRGLCSGKGFLFSDRGEFVAKGFEEPVRVYEVRWRE